MGLGRKTRTRLSCIGNTTATTKPCVARQRTDIPLAIHSDHTLAETRPLAVLLKSELPNELQQFFSPLAFQGTEQKDGSRLPRHEGFFHLPKRLKLRPRPSLSAFVRTAMIGTPWYSNQSRSARSSSSSCRRTSNKVTITHSRGFLSTKQVTIASPPRLLALRHPSKSVTRQIHKVERLVYKIKI